MGYSGPLEDRLAIRELIESYSDAVMRRDAEAWGGNWAEDGIWRFHGREVLGREAIVALWRQAMAAYASIGFFATPGALAVSGDRATGRCYTLEYLTPTQGPQRQQVGAYDDEYVRVGGVWKFAVRAFSVVQKQPA